MLFSIGWEYGLCQRILFFIHEQKHLCVYILDFRSCVWTAVAATPSSFRDSTNSSKFHKFHKFHKFVPDMSRSLLSFLYIPQIQLCMCSYFWSNELKIQRLKKNTDWNNKTTSATNFVAKLSKERDISGRNLWNLWNLWNFDEFVESRGKLWVPATAVQKRDRKSKM